MFSMPNPFLTPVTADVVSMLAGCDSDDDDAFTFADVKSAGSSALYVPIPPFPCQPQPAGKFRRGKHQRIPGVHAVRKKWNETKTAHMDM
eukprot:5035397-Pleurochrysis_carterae.AAC.1